jgi:hypothetical protein
MKRTLSNYLLPFIALILLSQCADKKKEQLVGIWRLDKVNINGVEIPGNSLGNQLWEFNDNNGYLVMIAGAKEKGKFTLKENKLLLKSLTTENKPETEYRIEKLDSTEMHLAAEYDKNKSFFSFVKVEGEEVAGEDD